MCIRDRSWPVLRSRCRCGARYGSPGPGCPRQRGADPAPARSACLLQGSTGCCMTLREPSCGRVLRRFSLGVVLVAGSCSSAHHEIRRIPDAGVPGEFAVRREVLDGAGRGPGCRVCRGRLLAARAVRPRWCGVDDEELRELDRVVPALVRADRAQLAGRGRTVGAVHDVADLRRSVGLGCRGHHVGGAGWAGQHPGAVSYTHLRAHETDSYLVCRLLLEKKKKKKNKKTIKKII